MLHLPRKFVLAALIGFLLTGFGIGIAQEPVPTPPVPDFKIESQVYIDHGGEAVCTNQTIFNAGLVIDLQFAGSSDEPIEICIYDARQRNFILLNMQKEIRLQLDQLQLHRISEAMKHELGKNETTEPLAFEDYQEEYSPEKNTVSVSNEMVAYVSHGIRPRNELIMAPYYNYLDQYALIAVTDPQRLPPFARLN